LNKSVLYKLVHPSFFSAKNKYIENGQLGCSNLYIR